MGKTGQIGACLLACFLLTGCTGMVNSQPVQEPYSPIDNEYGFEEYSLEGWHVRLFNTIREVEDYCLSYAPLYVLPPGWRMRGCTLYRIQTIVCVVWDFYACGHELHHITHGSFHGRLSE